MSSIHSIDATFAMLRTLRPDWDGQGAASVLPEAIDRAETLVRNCRRSQGKPSRVMATPAGTILIEWQKGGNYREAEVGGNGPVEWMEKLHRKPARHWLESGLAR